VKKGVYLVILPPPQPALHVSYVTTLSFIYYKAAVVLNHNQPAVKK